MNTKRNPFFLLAVVLATVGGVRAAEPAHPTGQNLTEAWLEVRFQGNKMG